MYNLHHRHLLTEEDARQRETVDMKKVIRSISESTHFFNKRSGKDDCDDDDSSPECQKPVNSQALPIGLGVGIPLGIAVVVLIFLHFKHVKKLKKEENEDKLDIDMEDYDPREQGFQAAAGDNGEKPKHYPNGLGKFAKNVKGNGGGGGDREKQSSDGGSSTKAGSVDEKIDPFYATPYIAHPENIKGGDGIEQYSRSLNSIYDANQYPSSASIYSQGVTPSFMLGGSSNSINGSINGNANEPVGAPRFPSPVRRAQDSMSRISSRQSNLSYSDDKSLASTSRFQSGSALNNNNNNSNATQSSPLKTSHNRSLEKEQSPFESQQDSDAENDDTRSYDDNASDASSSSSNRSYNESGNGGTGGAGLPMKAPQMDEFDFTPAHTPRASQFVIADEEDMAADETKQSSGLNRSDTKSFDRVQSVYEEYMSPQKESHEQPFHELPSRQAPVEHHEPPPRFDNKKNSVVGELPSRSAPVEHHEPPPGFSTQDPKSNNQLSATTAAAAERYPSPPTTPEDDNAKVDQKQMQQENMPPPSSAKPSMPSVAEEMPHSYPTPPLQLDQRQMPQQQQKPPYQLQPAPRNITPQHDAPSPEFYDAPNAPTPSDYDHSMDASRYSDQYYPTHPVDDPYMQQQQYHQRMPRNNPSNGSEYSSMTDESRPFPPSVSQQGRRSAQPLPKLTDLASPHSLDETSSPIAYAPKARNQKKKYAPPVTTPSPSFQDNTQMPTSPSGALPSPHALRQSAMLMSSVDFAPPKKFTNGGGNKTRSGSMSNSASPSVSSFQSPYGAGSVRGSYENMGNLAGNVTPRGTPNSQSQLNHQLVPDAKNNDMLRPTMDMRS